LRQQQQFQLLQVKRPLHMDIYTPGQQIYVTDSQGHLFATVVPTNIAPGATFCVRAPIMSSCTSSPVLARTRVAHSVTEDYLAQHIPSGGKAAAMAAAPRTKPAVKQSHQKAKARGTVPAGKRKRLAAAESGKDGALEKAFATGTHSVNSHPNGADGAEGEEEVEVEMVVVDGLEDGVEVEAMEVVVECGTAVPASAAPASVAMPLLPPARGGPLYALEPDGAPCGVAAPGQSQTDVVAPSTCTCVSLPPATPDSELSSTALVTTVRPSVELCAALVSAQIQAELEVGQHVYAKQWARPAVQWGGVQWDASLETAIAAELFQPSALAELFQPSALGCSASGTQ